MVLEPGPSGPREQASNDVHPDFGALWDQLVGLSSLVHQLEKEIGGDESELYSDVMKAMAGGAVEPENDWKATLDVLSPKSSLYKQRLEHFLAAARQEMYFQYLDNNNRGIEVLSKMLPDERSTFLARLYAKMAICIAWGYWHCIVSLKIHAKLKKSAREKGSKGGRGKAIQRNEPEIFLRVLIKGRLKNRPTGGWPRTYDTAKKIAASLEPFIEECGVDIYERGDDLHHRIEVMIENDASLMRIYDENRK